jgi:hypothetical protein
MLNSMQELAHHSVVVVLYNSGASGEFVAHALSESIEEFSKTVMIWENKNRCKFQDFFGRSLNNGQIVEDLLIKRINLYFENIVTPGPWHMGIAHGQPEYIDFLQKYGHNWPVIEITTLHPVSKKFQHLARNEKLSDLKTLIPKKNFTCLDMGFKVPNHLQIEWNDLLLADTKNTYNKIIEFLGAHGNPSRFQTMVDDYINKNQDLIKGAHES